MGAIIGELASYGKPRPGASHPDPALPGRLRRASVKFPGRASFPECRRSGRSIHATEGRDFQSPCAIRGALVQR